VIPPLVVALRDVFELEAVWRHDLLGEGTPHRR
jgi:hypothetical protein